MKILICCDEPPFPPRNGVTIPTAGYIRMLAQEHTVDCLVLTRADGEKNDVHLAATAQEVRRLFVIPRVPARWLLRVLGEVLFGKATFHSWRYPRNPDLPEPRLAEYDAVIATPISALDYPLARRANHPRLIAAISDSYTAVLNSELQWFAMLSLGRAWRALRARRMAGIERRILERCSVVLVQTALDRKLVAEIGGPGLAERTLVCPNGVPDSLLAQPLPGSLPHPRLLLAVSSFREPLYRRNLERFVQYTWQEIKREVPDARLRITGNGLQNYDALYSQLLADPQVELVGFVEDIRQVYTDVRLVLAPIYKSYGYINKVAEAFAAGLPVLGDPSAFNGLERSLTMGCGIIARTPDDFSAPAIRYLTEDAVWREASTRAREYANTHLTWQSRMPTLQRAVGSS